MSNTPNKSNWESAALQNWANKTAQKLQNVTPVNTMGSSTKQSTPSIQIPTTSRPRSNSNVTGWETKALQNWASKVNDKLVGVTPVNYAGEYKRNVETSSGVSPGFGSAPLIKAKTESSASYRKGQYASNIGKFSPAGEFTLTSSYSDIRKRVTDLADQLDNTFDEDRRWYMQEELDFYNSVLDSSDAFRTMTLEDADWAVQRSAGPADRLTRKISQLEKDYQRYAGETGEWGEENPYYKDWMDSKAKLSTAQSNQSMQEYRKNWLSDENNVTSRDEWINENYKWSDQFKQWQAAAADPSRKAEADILLDRLTKGYGAEVATAEERAQMADALHERYDVANAELQLANKEWQNALVGGTSPEALELNKKREEAQARYDDIQKRVRDMGGYASNAGDIMEAVGQNVLSDLTSFGAYAVDVIDAVFDVTDAVEVKPFIQFAQDYRKSAQTAMSEVTTGMSPEAAFFTSLAPSIIEATATMGVAMMVGAPAAATTATLNTASQAATLSRVGSAVRSASQILSSMASNPVYWTSFAHVTGMYYMDAINEGMSREYALLYSTIGGALNAALEIGGVEALPGSIGAARVLNTETLTQLTKKMFLDTFVEEGMEEVAQGIVERALGVLMKGEDREAFSVTDKEAVISLLAAMEEFAGGYLCGAVLGPLGSASQIGDAITKRNYVKTLNQVNMSLPEDMRLPSIDLQTVTAAELDTYRYELVKRCFSASAETALTSGVENGKNRDSVRKKLYNSIQSANPEASILNPLAEAIRMHPLYAPKGHRAGHVDEQAKLIERILDGKYLSDTDLQKLDLNDGAIRAVFVDHTGLTGMPDGVTSLSLKREYVDRVVKAVRNVRANQKAMKDGATAGLQNKAEQTGASATANATNPSITPARDADASTRKNPFKKSKGTRTESTYKDYLARAGREARISTKGRTVEEVMREIGTRSGLGSAIPDYATFMDNYIRGRASEAHSTTAALITDGHESYRAVLVKAGLTNAEIDAIISVNSTSNRRAVAISRAKAGDTKLLAGELAKAERNVALIQQEYNEAKAEFEEASQAAARALNSVEAAKTALRQDSKNKKLDRALRDAKNTLKGAEAVKEEARKALNKVQSRLFHALADYNELRTASGMEYLVVPGVNDGKAILDQDKDGEPEEFKEDNSKSDVPADKQEKGPEEGSGEGSGDTRTAETGKPGEVRTDQDEPEVTESPVEEPAPEQEEGTEEDGRIHEDTDGLRDDSDSQGRPESGEELRRAVHRTEEDNRGRDEGPVHETVHRGEAEAVLPSSEADAGSLEGGERENLISEEVLNFIQNETSNPEDLTIYDENESTEEIKVSPRALSVVRKLASVVGIEHLVFVTSKTGSLKAKDGTPANGMTSDDRSVVLVLLNPVKTPTSVENPAMTAVHECFHALVKSDSEIVQVIYDLLTKSNLKLHVEQTLEMPRFSSYRARYGKEDIYAGWEHNAETKRRLELKVFEEVLSDTFSGRCVEYTEPILDTVLSVITKRHPEITDVLYEYFDYLDEEYDEFVGAGYDFVAEKQDEAAYTSEWERARKALNDKQMAGKAQVDSMLAMFKSKPDLRPEPARVSEQKAEQVEKAKVELEETHKANPDVESLPELIEAHQAKAQEAAEKPKSAPMHTAPSTATPPAEDIQQLDTGALQERKQKLATRFNTLFMKKQSLYKALSTDLENTSLRAELAEAVAELEEIEAKLDPILAELNNRKALNPRNRTRDAFGIKQGKGKEPSAVAEIEKMLTVEHDDETEVALPEDYPPAIDKSSAARWKRDGYNFMAAELKNREAMIDVLVALDMIKAKLLRPNNANLRRASQHPTVRAVLRAAEIRKDLIDCKSVLDQTKRNGAERAEAVAPKAQEIIQRWAKNNLGILYSTLDGAYLDVAIEVSKRLMYGDLYPVGAARIMLDVMEKHYRGEAITEDAQKFLSSYKGLPSYSANSKVQSYVRMAATVDATKLMSDIKAKERPSFPRNWSFTTYPQLTDADTEGVRKVLEIAESKSEAVRQAHDDIQRNQLIDAAHDAAANFWNQTTIPSEYGAVMDSVFTLVARGVTTVDAAILGLLSIHEKYHGDPKYVNMALRDMAPTPDVRVEIPEWLSRSVDTYQTEEGREGVLARMEKEDADRDSKIKSGVLPEEYEEEIKLRLEEMELAQAALTRELREITPRLVDLQNWAQELKESHPDHLYYAGGLASESAESGVSTVEVLESEEWQDAISALIMEAKLNEETDSPFYEISEEEAKEILVDYASTFSELADLAPRYSELSEQMRAEEGIIQAIMEEQKGNRGVLHYALPKHGMDAEAYDRSVRSQATRAAEIRELEQASYDPEKRFADIRDDHIDDAESDDFIRDNITLYDLPIGNNPDTYVAESEKRDRIRRDILDPESQLNQFFNAAEDLRPKDGQGRDETALGIVRRTISAFWDMVDGMRTRGVTAAIKAGFTKEQATNTVQIRKALRTNSKKDLSKSVRTREDKKRVRSEHFSNMPEYGKTSYTNEEKLRQGKRNVKQFVEGGRHFVFNTNDEVDIIGHLSGRVANAYTMTNTARSASDIGQRQCLENMVDVDGRNIGESIQELTVVKKTVKTATGTKVVHDAERQLVFDELLYCYHELDRMSAKKRAEDDLIEYLAEHEHLRELTKDELSDLYLSGNTEVVDLFRRRKTVETLEPKAVLLDDLDSPTPEKVQAIIDKIESDPANADLLEMQRKLYEHWDVFMRTYVVGNQVSLDDYNYWRWLYPHYVPTHRAAATEKTKAKAAIDAFLKQHEGYKDKTDEELADLVAQGDTFAIELCALLEDYRTAPDTPADRKLSTGGALNHGDTSLAPGAAIKSAVGSFLPLLAIPDQFANLTLQYTRVYWYNQLTKNIIEEAMTDYDGTFAEYVQFDWEYAARQDKVDMEELEKMNEDLEHLLKPDENGKQYYIYAWFNGTRLRAKVSAGVFEGLEATMHAPGRGRFDSMTRFLMKAGRTLSTPSKMMITGYNPFFALRNPWRDFQTALINTTANPFEFVRCYRKAWKQMYGNSENWQDFVNLGGSSANFFQYSRGFGSRIFRGMSPDPTFADRATKQKGLGRRMLDTMGAFGEATESVTRFAEYLATIEGAKARGEWNEKTAASYKLSGIKNAAEVTTDFGRSGTVGQFGNAFVLYLNANLQGLSKMYRVIAEQPTWQKKFGRFGRAAMVTLIPEIILYAILKSLGRFDDWDGLSDYYKLNYFCFPVGETRWLMVPKTRDWSALIGNPVLMAGEVMRGRDIHAAYQSWWETSFRANMVPPSLGDAIGVSTLLAFAKNEDFAGRAIVPYGTEDGSKGLQYDEDTKWLAYQIATLGNELLGKDKFSPAKLDYLIDSYMGSFWGGLFDLLTVGDMTSIEEDGMTATLLSEETGTSIVRDIGDFMFVDSGKSAQVVGDYYDMIASLDKKVTDDSNKYGTATHTREYQIRAAMNSKNSFVANMREVNAAIKEAKTQEERDKLYAIRNGIAADALAFYEDCMSGKIQDPKLHIMYEPYSDRMMNEAIRLAQYAEEYNFHPDATAPTNFNNPLDPDGKTKFVGLTDEQKDEYLRFWSDAYGRLTTLVLNSAEYKSLTPRAQANELKRAKDKAGEQAHEMMAEWLIRHGVKPVAKTQAEIYADEQTAKHAFNRLVENSWYSKQTTDEVIRLADYGIELPTYTPSSYTHPTDDRYIFRLTDEEQDVYKNMRNGIYDGLAVYFMNLSYYNQLSDYDKANLMSAVGRATTELAKVNFKNWLVQNSVPQPKKTWETEEEKRIENEYDELVKYFLAQAGIKY